MQRPLTPHPLAVSSRSVTRTQPFLPSGWQSIKSKTTAFALLATLIPSLTMGWLFYVQNKRLLSAKISQELENVTSHASREIDLWFKERLYDVRVFASSYVVTESLEKLLAGPGVRAGDPALRRLQDYLRSVQGKFTDYEELAVLAPDGRVVASSAERPGPINMPDGWLARARSGEAILGAPAWDESLRTGIVTVSQPIVSADDSFLGVLAAKLNFRGIRGILKGYSPGDINGLYLVAPGGAVVASTRPLAPRFISATLPAAAANRLFAKEGALLEYVGPRGQEMIGTLKNVPTIPFGVVAEKERAAAYAEIYRLRNMTIGLVGVLLLAIGVGAYLFALTIVRPLDRLIGGAAKVATGDLDVDLPMPSRGELRYMTEVFNHMVEQLRLDRKELDEINQTLLERNRELQELSVTDSLTGLFNRKHMWETLAREVETFKRYGRPLAVLMIDIDHFKRYNDSHGHLAGDEVLRRMAVIFRGSLRASDYVARYGGEEFLVVLPDADGTTAEQVAERIRALAAAEEFVSDGDTARVMVSVGVASASAQESEPEFLVRNADAALYRAKETGRDRVVVFGAAEPGGQRPPRRRRAPDR
jgi:diguanylate cyclase (GGDEF)-like protein